MFREDLPESGGLIIQPYNGVVSFFLRFPIDVVSINADGMVCYQVREMVSWRMSKVDRKSTLVIEFSAGVLEATGTSLGDKVTIDTP